MDNFNNFGRGIRLIREIMGLTQKEFSQLVGITSTILIHYESGRVKPSLKNLINLCKQFSISLDAISDLELANEKIPAYKIYLMLHPSFEDNLFYIPDKSLSRVLKLVRIFKEIPYEAICYRNAQNNMISDKNNMKMSYVAFSRIESLKNIPGTNSLIILCKAYNIETSKILYYTQSTEKMTWNEAAIFIAKDLASCNS